MPHITVGYVGDLVGSYARGVFRGVGRYARLHPTWKVVPLTASSAALPSVLADSNLDGLIVQVAFDVEIESLAGWKKPIVNTSNKRSNVPFPQVISDDWAVGRMAGAHLVERGFRTVAYIGQAQMQFAIDRGDGFVTRLAEAGLDVQRHVVSTWRESGLPASTRTWLRQLAKPAAVFCSSDVIARKVLDQCLEVGIRVPDHVAVIGVDDDELELAQACVPLSSIQLDLDRIGYEAATLAHRLIEAASIPTTPVRVPPVGVISRASSDALAFDDPDVVAAVRYVRSHACAGISVSDVIDAVTVSRRTLEPRFRRMVGHTVYDEITRCRIDRAKQLLAESDWSIARIAEASGYAAPKQLSIAFRREMAMSPRDYRHFRRSTQSTASAEALVERS